MKHTILFLVLCMVCSIQAQEIEKNFVPYYLKDGKAIAFERKSAKPEAKVIGMGYGGMNQYLTVFNSKHSEVRFAKDSLPKFVIQLDPGTDPLDLVIVSKADVVKKRKTYRRFIQKGNTMGGGSKDISQYHITPKLTKIEGDLYAMEFSESLEAGEYSFLPIYKGQESANILSTTGDVRIYCFGVD